MLCLVDCEGRCILDDFKGSFVPIFLGLMDWDSHSCLRCQPVDFTLLKPQTTEFLRELFSWILVNSQVSTPVLTDDLSSLSLTKNRAAIEEIFIKASRTDTLAMGLVYFLTETFKPLRSQTDPASKFLTWGVNLATDTLRSGLDIVPGL